MLLTPLARMILSIAQMQFICEYIYAFIRPHLTPLFPSDQF